MQMSLKLKQPPLPEAVLSDLDPRWKLAALLLASLAVSMLHHVPAAAAALAGALLLALAARLPLRWYLARLGAVAAFLFWFAVMIPFVIPDSKPGLEIGRLHISYGLTVAILVCLKALAIITLVLVHLGTTPLPATLKAAHALHVPGLVVQVAMLAYRYIFVVAGEFVRVRIALRVRGFRSRANRHSYRTLGQVSGTLLVKAYERAEAVGQAMRCRGFDGQFRALAQFRTAAADILFFCVVVAFAAVLLAWSVGQG
jgi:cobalt/nickel transport system permease protein